MESDDGISGEKNQLVDDFITRKIFETDRSEQQIIEFFDVVAENPKAVIRGKGVVNTKISAQLFNYLGSYQIPTCFLKIISDNAMLVKSARKLPLECRVLNVATQQLTEKFGVPGEKELAHPMIEYFTKDKQGNWIAINETHPVALEIVNAEEMRYIKHLVSKTNVLLKSFFARRDFKLVEFKLAFGIFNKYIMILDDLSLDSIHIWDLKLDIHYHSAFFAENRPEMPSLLDELQRRISGEL